MDAMQIMLNLSDADFTRYCEANPDLRIERTAEGNVLVLEHSGWENSSRNAEIIAGLHAWSKRDCRCRRSLHASERSGALRACILGSAITARNPYRRSEAGFPTICPDFVVELRSPSDRLPGLQAKMREWIDNGAKVGWLIDPTTRTVYVYRPGQTTERLVDPRLVEGESPVDSFVLEMAGIWSPDL